MFDDDRKQIVREPEIRFFHEPRTEVIEMSESSPGYSGIIDKYVSFLCIKKTTLGVEEFFQLFDLTKHKSSQTFNNKLYIAMSNLYIFIIIKLPLDENREEFFRAHLWLVKY